MERRMACFIQGDRPEAGAELAMTVALTQQLLGNRQSAPISAIFGTISRLFSRRRQRKERGNAGNHRLRGRGPDGRAEEVADEGYHRRGGEKFPRAAGSRDRADRRIEKGLEGERWRALYRTVSRRADAGARHGA